MNTRKVWARVEVLDPAPGYDSPRLVGGVDIEKAQALIRELYRWPLG